MIDETEKDALFPNGKTTDSTNSDDFDKLLEEFIREETADLIENEDEVDSSTFEGEDEVDSKNWKVEKVEYAYLLEPMIPETYQENTFFRFKKDDAQLWVQITASPLTDLPRSTELAGVGLLCTDHGEVLESEDFIVTYEGTDDKMTGYISFVITNDNPYINQTLYTNTIFKLIIISSVQNEVFRQKLFFFNIPDTFAACFSFVDFRLLSLHKEGKYMSSSAGPLCQFDGRRLTTIEVNYWIRRVAVNTLSLPFELYLYNEMGQIVEHQVKTIAYLPDEENGLVCIRWLLGTELASWVKGTYLIEILFFDELVISASFVIGRIDQPGVYNKNAIQPHLYITKKDSQKSVLSPTEALDRMIGLSSIKERIYRYADYMKLFQKRKQKGLAVERPPLHAAFLGNPGTGKTTVARLLGAILKDIGVLSKGHVVVRERSTLTGHIYCLEQEMTLDALKEAKGGILFIDEAYTLYKKDDSKDPGKNVLETLLTALSDEKNRDWMLLLAGYTEEMNDLFTCNPGLDSRIPVQNRFYFSDYSVDELMKIAEQYCADNHYILTDNSRKALLRRITYDYQLRDQYFGNGRYVKNLFTSEILQSMSIRVNRISQPTLVELMTIEEEDIPETEIKDMKRPLKKLHEMVGLVHLKKSIENHLNMVKLSILRRDLGLKAEMPPLHMAFVGNPGTGKTTVADLIGEIYAAMGILSVGRVIKVERKDLVGQYIGETEAKTAAVLNRAKGNVLFIDEAYALCVDDKSQYDFGYRVIEVLLTALAKEPNDLLVVLAGYPAEMEQLMDMNPGLRSRIPYTFYFEDYSVEELMEIATGLVKKLEYSFTSAALKALRNLLCQVMHGNNTVQGNARFITRLITNQIIPAMSNRLLRLPPKRLKNKKVLQLICKEDIPATVNQPLEGDENQFGEKAIKQTLKKLDSMVGLSHVKKAIHRLVDIAVYQKRNACFYFERESLKWTFLGNTGTGKSTVASILAEILRALHVLDKGHVVEVKAEELYGVADYKVDEILKEAMHRSQQGVLFIDGDAPQFKNPDSQFNADSLRFKLSSMMMELPGAYALIIAEQASKNFTLSKSLLDSGIPEFDHTLYFDDYTKDELFQILKQFLKRRKLEFDQEASFHIAAYITGLCSQRELGYANARTMKSLSNTIAGNYYCRMSQSGNGKTSKITIDDVRGFVWKQVMCSMPVGYVKKV